MTIYNSTITKGFIAAGLLNASVLVFSRFFTNPTIAKFDPDVMSNFGLVMIIIWGLAYISVAKNHQKLKWLIGVFALEKFVYGCVWTKWMLNNDISAVYDKDLMAGMFYSVYGINDWLFCAFFIFVFIRVSKSHQ